MDWGRRGVVTGSHMFSRYLGQSLGAALFGAIFNAALQARLAQAPAALRAGLPTQVDGVLAALQAPTTPAPVAGYLRQAIGAATDALYLGMAVLALLMLLALLLAPRRFTVIDEGPKSSTTG